MHGHRGARVKRISGYAVRTLLLLMLLPAMAAAQQRTLQFVYGRLLDDATRGPIVGGGVSLLMSDGRVALTVFTDSTGSFRLQAPLAGEYMLKAERIGYQTAKSK